MKRILGLVLALGLIFSCFAGCSNDENKKGTAAVNGERELYNVELEEYIKIGNYKGLKIDKESDEYKKTHTSMIMSDVEENDLYFIRKDGIVNDGDSVNINFVGKKDGVAFDGGTGSGYNLVIGSDSFIDGFEDGLIGKEIGSTVDLNLTFPENYGNEELNGAEVVFTVTINHVTTTSPREPEDYYMSLKYASVEDYYDDVENRTIEKLLQDQLNKNFKILDYPKNDIETNYKDWFDRYNSYFYKEYQVTVEDYLEYTGGRSIDDFKVQAISQEVKPIMDEQMIWYAIFDKEGFKVSAADRSKSIKRIIREEGLTGYSEAETVEEYGAMYVEAMSVRDKVFDFLKKNAKIS